jgi:hypothetical protein
MHATFGSPPNSTFIKAISRGYGKNLPRLSARIIAANPPSSLATAKGHLYLNRKNQRSSKRLLHKAGSESQFTVASLQQPLELDEFETELASEGSNNDLFVKEINLSDTYYTDGTAHLPVTSRHGNYSNGYKVCLKVSMCF